MIEVDLVAFDDADFAELVNGQPQHGPHRVEEVLRTTGDLLALLIAVAAAVLTTGLLHPVLAPVVLLAALPQAGRRCARRS